jgi:hypothetical protein
VLARTRERERGKEPVRFHMRVSSPPSKSSSSEEEPSRSVSPSSSPAAFSGLARCGPRGVGHLYVRKMRWGCWDAAGVDGAGADEEADAGIEEAGRDEGRGSRCVVP